MCPKVQFCHPVHQKQPRSETATPLPEPHGTRRFDRWRALESAGDMTDNPPPNGWERVQLVWQPREAALRDRRDDERTVVGEEREHTKFIVATPIGVSGRR